MISKSFIIEHSTKSGDVMSIDIDLIVVLSTFVFSWLFEKAFRKLTQYDRDAIEDRKQMLHKKEKKLEKEKQKIKKLEAEYERRQKRIDEKIYGKRDNGDNIRS